MAKPIASAASALALSSVSRLSFACSCPARAQMSRPRRTSAQNSRNTGASAIQGMVPTQPAMAAMGAGSVSTTMEYCCRSLFDGALCAAASTACNTRSGTGSARNRRVTLRPISAASAGGSSAGSSKGWCP